MGERHRIISNDWLAAHMQSLIGTLSGPRRGHARPRRPHPGGAAGRPGRAPRRARSGSTPPPRCISRAADLCCESAELVHDNERRWRVTRERTEQLVQAMTAHTATPADRRHREGVRCRRGTARRLTRKAWPTDASARRAYRSAVPVPQPAGRRPTGGRGRTPAAACHHADLPSRGPADQPQPVRMLPAELHADVERLLLGEKPLLRGERLPAELHLHRGVLMQIPVPVGFRAPPAQITASPVCLVVAQHHCDGLIRRPVLRPTWVNATNVRPTAGPALCW